MISPIIIHLSFAILASLFYRCFFSSSSSQYPGPAKQRHHATHQGKKISKKSDTRANPPNRKGNPAAPSALEAKKGTLP